MVCVDTSVFIAASRNPGHRAAEVLRSLAPRREIAVCGQVWIEFIGGSQNADRRRTFAAAWRAYTYLETSRAAYELAAEWRGTEQGFGSADAVIAATAHSRGVPLLTLDLGLLILERHGLQVRYIS